MQKRPCKWTALSIGTLLGNLEGFIYWDFERKGDCVSGFLFCGPRGHKKLSLGAIWNFSKEQGCTELITDYESQKARYIRPRCNGTVRAPTQMLIN